MLGYGKDIASSFSTRMAVKTSSFGLQAGDLLLAVAISFYPDSSYPTPEAGASDILGWTTLLTDSYPSSNSYKVYSRQWGSSEPNTLASFLVNNEPGVLHVTGWTGVDPSTPIAAFADLSNSHASSTAIDAPSVLAVDNSVLYCAFSWSKGGSFSGPTTTIDLPVDLTRLGGALTDAAGDYMALTSGTRAANAGATGVETATAGGGPTAGAHTTCAGMSVVMQPPIPAFDWFVPAPQPAVQHRVDFASASAAPGPPPQTDFPGYAHVGLP